MAGAGGKAVNLRSMKQVKGQGEEMALTAANNVHQTQQAQTSVLVPLRNAFLVP